MDYILDVAASYFPSAQLNQADVLSSFAGLRPIIHGGAEDPSAASRKHVVWEENDLITITGGKLTIFRKMAEDAMQKAARRLGLSLNTHIRYFDALPKPNGAENVEINSALRYALAGKYGFELPELLNVTRPGELSSVQELPTIRAELRYAARRESVQHLDDLLLRRTRLGLLLPDGARAELPALQEVAREELGWDDARWDAEVKRYTDIYERFYSPAPAGI